MEVVFFLLIGIAWSIVKGLFLILATYYIYNFLVNCIETVWEIIHPKSLKWVKSKFNKKRGDVIENESLEDKK